MKETLNQIFYGNTVLHYLVVFGSMLLLWIVWRLIKKWLIRFVVSLTAKTQSNIDNLLVDAARNFILPYVYLFFQYRIFQQLNLSPEIEKILSVAAMLVTTYFVVRLIIYSTQHLITETMKARNEPEQRIKQVVGMLLVFKVLVWGGGLVMLVDNLGYNVTTIIAGLGVGGIAIALAAQNILTDLFSYIVIFFDKPFEIGDFITANNFSGTVEKIGIKTSHVRSPDGQQLVMPNTEMVKSVIQNFKRLEKRRVVFMVGVVYETPAEKLRSIPSIAEQIILAVDHAEFARAHFKSFGDFSLNFEIVYFVDSPDYTLYMDTHQQICLLLFEKFQQAGIDFAYPTQVVLLNNGEKEAAPAENKAVWTKTSAVQ
ncbi:MAG TPA: mechanosensitive ion channel family protein [Flavihumibacter sp.]|nr:mechanosensitive ion channel family protein [Bacteroidota bacterium]HQD10813.1 mechanosensitive ion channel family protein [Flavihumibacter sp.]